MTTRITITTDTTSHKSVSARVCFAHDALPDGTTTSVAEQHTLAPGETVAITLWGDRWVQIDEVVTEAETQETTDDCHA